MNFSQCLSNMLRQSIAFGAVVLAVGLDVICYGEPINRQHRNFVINNNAVNIDCTGNRADSPECRSLVFDQNNNHNNNNNNNSNSNSNNNANINSNSNNSKAITAATVKNQLRHHDDNGGDDDDTATADEDQEVTKSWGIADIFEDYAVEEARGKKKKGRGWILIAGAMKAMFLYMLIHGVAILAGKALIVAKVALAIAGALALKKALEHNDKTSYEIVKHPQHSFVQSHSSSVDYDHGGGFDGHRRKRFIR